MTEFDFAKSRDAVIDSAIERIEGTFAKTGEFDAFTDGYKIARNIAAMDDFEAVLAMRADVFAEMRHDASVQKSDRVLFVRATAQIEIVYYHMRGLLEPQPANQRPSRPSEPSP